MNQLYALTQLLTGGSDPRIVAESIVRIFEAHEPPKDQRELAEALEQIDRKIASGA